MGEAKEITKIIIKGSSGYCAYSEAYKDRLTIEKGKISYEYLPEEEAKINPVRKWNYTTIPGSAEKDDAFRLCHPLPQGFDLLCHQ